MDDDDAKSLLATCEAVLLAPDGHTLEWFLEAYPIGTVTRVLQSGPGSRSEASTIIRGIKHLTETSTSNDALQEMLTPAQHALASESPQLRVLGCDILSVWLKRQEASAEITQPVLLLIHMLEQHHSSITIHDQVQDGETEVAAAAASALECLAVPPERLQQWLQPEGQGGLLAASIGHQDATVRSRALSLTVKLAASSPEAAEMVLSSGALEPFLSELANGDDLLARLAALEQLLELSETATVPPALRARIAPHVLQLLEGSADPTLQQAAVPAVARLLQDGQDTALVAQVVSKLSVAVQEDEIRVDMEACILDATGTLAQSTACREAVAKSELLQHACERSLGRGAPDAICIPAMHVMAAVGGAELLRETDIHSSAIQSALLSDSAEKTLKQAVYDKALPSKLLELGPAQRVLELLQSPFSDRKVPAYRMFTALAAREWFALEVCQHTEVMAHVCAAQSESGDLSMWRFGLLRILDASATAAAAGSALSQYRGQLHEAVSKGPYGVAGHTGLPADVEPQVAVASRAG